MGAGAVIVTNGHKHFKYQQKEVIWPRSVKMPSAGDIKDEEETEQPSEPDHWM